MILYLCGKMRGLPRFGFDNFDAARDLLKSLDIASISPADMDRALGFDPDVEGSLDGFDIHAAMRRDIAAVINPWTDGIVRIWGWRTSQGCAVEQVVNEAVGGLVFDAVYDEDETLIGIEEVG